jgi:transposase
VASYRLRLLLTHRRNLKRKALDLENAIRHSLKAFGIRLSRVGRGGFAQAMRDAVAGDALVSELIDAMLNARAEPWKEYCRLHKLVVKLVARHELCRRFMQIPGRRSDLRLELHDRDRRSIALQTLARCGGVFWTDVAAQSGSSIDVQGRSKAGTPMCGARSTKRQVRC